MVARALYFSSAALTLALDRLVASAKAYRSRPVTRKNMHACHVIMCLSIHSSEKQNMKRLPRRSLQLPSTPRTP